MSVILHSMQCNNNNDNNHNHYYNTNHNHHHYNNSFVVWFFYLFINVTIKANNFKIKLIFIKNFKKGSSTCAIVLSRLMKIIGQSINFYFH